MKLAAAESLVRKIGAAGHGDSLELADAALEYATTLIENTLNSPLEAATVADYFDYTPSRLQNSFYDLQLLASRGFWDTTQTIAVYVSDTSAALPADLSVLTPLGESYYTYDHDQGTLALAYRPSTGRQTIAITYSAGFTEGGSRQIPKWLENASLGYGVQNMQLHNMGYLKKDFRDKSTEQSRSAYSLISNKIRTRVGQSPSNTRIL